MAAGGVWEHRHGELAQQLPEAVARVVTARALVGGGPHVPRSHELGALLRPRRARTRKDPHSAHARRVSGAPDRGRVHVEAMVASAGYVDITVTDTGMGMSESEVLTAMTPFGQVDAGFNKRHEGTGLGIPIAFALARLHNGDLKIASVKGQGTRVTITLPTFSPSQIQPPLVH